jgi:short-subunit dehydrogenase
VIPTANPGTAANRAAVLRASVAGGPFHDRVAIVTGASQGIGRELARQLAAQGARLSLAARSREELERLAADCRAAVGHAPLVVPTDVEHRDECRRLVDATLDRFGRLDLLINNAGVSMWARFAELRDPGLVEHVVQVNFLGGVYCTYYALDALRASRGRIVAISSAGGKVLGPGSTAYVASKAAMRAFYESLHVELAGQGVSVTAVYPGFVDTEIYQRFLGPDGRPTAAAAEAVPRRLRMPVERCATKILRAAARRQPVLEWSWVARAARLVNWAAPWAFRWYCRTTLDRLLPEQPAHEQATGAAPLPPTAARSAGA